MVLPLLFGGTNENLRLVPFTEVVMIAGCDGKS